MLSNWSKKKILETFAIKLGTRILIYETKTLILSKYLKKNYQHELLVFSVACTRHDISSPRFT